MYIQVHTCVCIYVCVEGGGLFSFAHVILKYIQEHSYSYGKSCTRSQKSVKGEPRMGDDPFAITFLLKMAFLLIAAHWNSSFLNKSETAVSP